MTIVVLQLIGILRALVEIAGMALLGQAALFVLCAGRHRQNPVYQLLAMVARPAVVATRRIVPQADGERRIYLLAFVLLFLLWIVLAYIRLALQA